MMGKSEYDQYLRVYRALNDPRPTDIQKTFREMFEKNEVVGHDQCRKLLTTLSKGVVDTEATESNAREVVISVEDEEILVKRHMLDTLENDSAEYQFVRKCIKRFVGDEAGRRAFIDAQEDDDGDRMEGVIHSIFQEAGREEEKDSY